jgi:DNA repair protein RadA/Sms
MTKNVNKTLFVCSNCGNEFSMWNGKCLSCGEWNTLREMKEEILSGRESGGEKIVVKSLSDHKSEKGIRTKTGFIELDIVFGGGIVRGSVILLGGEPGIGKSTLLLQILKNTGKVLYVSGEESLEQIKLRADRLEINTKNISISSTPDISNLDLAIADFSPGMIVVDSIQTVYDARISGSAGSQTQVKESGLLLQQLAKKFEVPIIIAGHVTKEGVVAGPKMLEHLVDVVVYMEGERGHDARILRCVKNRFGNTDEIAVMRMESSGLKEVKNPGTLFISETGNGPGSAITILIEGTRPLLVEIQALVVPTSFGYPRRTTSGFDLNRLNILIGVIGKRAGINLSNHDIYLSVVGGISAREPASDLAALLAIVSSFKNKPLAEKTCFFSEVGLTGEIRKVSLADKRKKEAQKLGYNVVSGYHNIREAIEKNF